ncbi:hypothetical protein ASB7_00490 [Helicobacter ailurogastricus]|nr:hypothetical protein ASB7_00490 [Helicobacter ailurogastricus]
MFAPLLESFNESSHLPPPPPTKKPLALRIQWYGSEEDFKGWFFYDILSHQYDLTLDSKNYTCFLGAHHRYLEGLAQALGIQAKRLAFMGENERIDFNVYDFGMGFDEIEFNDRYLRVPLYYLNLWQMHANLLKHTNTPFHLETTNPTKADFQKVHPQIDSLAREQSDPLKRGFASFVASNPNAPIRNAFYQELNTYKPGCGGVFNTIGHLVQNKHEFISGYKFNLCFENSIGLGYTTEKIIDAYFAHTIPIYWGNPEVAKDFNPKSFVNVHDFKDFKEALDFIRYLDTHDNAYLDMLHAHPLNTYEGKPRFYQDLSFSKILNFLQNAIECPHLYHEQNNLANPIYNLQGEVYACSGRQHLAMAFKKLLDKTKRVFKRPRTNA